MGVTVTGIHEVVLRLNNMSRRAAAPGPQLWNAIGRYLRGEFAKQFTTQGGYFGRPWEPLKLDYAAWKVKVGRGRRGILVFDGGLRDSYIMRSRAIQRPEGPNAWVYGSGHKLAPFHQYGTKSHKTGKPLLPPRKVIIATPKMRSDIAQMVQDYLAGNTINIPGGGASD